MLAMSQEWADIFESFVGSIIAAMVIAAAAELLPRLPLSLLLIELSSYSRGSISPVAEYQGAGSYHCFLLWWVSSQHHRSFLYACPQEYERCRCCSSLHDFHWSRLFLGWWLSHHGSGWYGHGSIRSGCRNRKCLGLYTQLLPALLWVFSLDSQQNTILV